MGAAIDFFALTEIASLARRAMAVQGASGATAHPYFAITIRQTGKKVAAKNRLGRQKVALKTPYCLRCLRSDRKTRRTRRSCGIAREISDVHGGMLEV